MLHTAPVSPPQMLTGDFINSTSIQVTWAPPPEDDVNGIIREYIVRYSLVDGPSAETSLSTNETSVVIAELDEYTLYEVSVSAVTVAEGPADSVQVRTDSDGELVVRVLPRIMLVVVILCNI